MLLNRRLTFTCLDCVAERVAFSVRTYKHSCLFRGATLLALETQSEGGTRLARASGPAAYGLACKLKRSLN